MAEARREGELILLLAGTSARRLSRRARIEELAGTLDWDRFARHLRARKLLSVIGPRLVELNEGAVPEVFASELDGALQAGRRQGSFLALVCGRAMAMLAEAGVACSTLKGPVLSEALYGDIGRRLSGDIDLLVRPRDLSRAAEVVRALGYAPPGDFLGKSGLPLLHLVLYHERDELPPVELHWRVHWYERRFAQERLLPSDPGESAAAWRPEPADELCELLLFYARDGFIDLRMASDIGAWWDENAERLGERALAPVLDAYPKLAHVIVASATVAERVLGISSVRLLGQDRRLLPRERVAVRMADPNPSSSPAQIYANMGLVDGLLIPSGGLRSFVRRQLLPPAAVLDEQAQQGERQRARSPLMRCLGVLGRYALALVLLARPRGATHRA